MAAGTLTLRWKKSVYATIGITSNYQGTDSESYPIIYRSQENQLTSRIFSANFYNLFNSSL